MKSRGDKVSGGTVNTGNGFLTVRTTVLAEDSAVARLVRLVEEAASKRSANEALVERVAVFYTPSVMILAVIVATVPLAWDFVNWQRWWVVHVSASLARSLSSSSSSSILDVEVLLGTRVASLHSLMRVRLQSYPTRTRFYTGLVLLVVACPCALVISTPVTYVCGLAEAARRGIFVKGGQFLESLALVESFAMDKTGTLTEGEFKLVRVQPVPRHDSKEENETKGKFDKGCCGGHNAIKRSVEDLEEEEHTRAQAHESHEKDRTTLDTITGTWERKEILALLHVLESRSQHPIAAAMCAAAEEEGAQSGDGAGTFCQLVDESFEVVPGQVSQLTFCLFLSFCSCLISHYE